MSKSVFGYSKGRFMSHMIAAYSGIQGADAIDSIERWEAWFDKHATDSDMQDAPCENKNAAAPDGGHYVPEAIATAVINRVEAALEDVRAKMGCVPGSYLQGLMSGLRQEVESTGYVDRLIATQNKA